MKIKYFYLTVYISIIIIILCASLQNGDQSANESSVVTDTVIEVIEFCKNDEIDVSYDEVHFVVRKVIGHFGLFLLCGIFGLLTFYSFTSRNLKALYWTMIIGIGVAICSEMLQLFADGRSCEFKDMLIDSLGYLSGTIICLSFLIIINNKKTLFE